MSVLSRLPAADREELQGFIDSRWYRRGEAIALMAKAAGDATPVYDLGGRLYVSKSGWLLLSVPNAMVRGLFDGLTAPGVELPGNGSGGLEAHISVMTKDELASIGGPARVTERGHTFHYQTGQLKTCKPGGQAEFSRVWFVEVASPELKQLRASYGLPAEPKYKFHITVAYRRVGALRDNGVAKAG